MDDAPTVQAPEARDLAKETKANLQAQIDLAPAVYSSEATYRPKYANLENRLLQESLLGNADQRGLLDLYQNDINPFVRQQQTEDAALSNQLLSRQRSQDIADVELYGQRASDAFRKANPLIDELTKQAQADLTLRGALSPEEQRQVDQQTRMAYADRGMIRNNRAIGDELLNRDTYKRQKMFQDRDFALKIAQQQTDPFMAILGRGSRQIDSSSGQSLLGQGGFSQNAGNTMFGMNQGQSAQYSSQLNSENFDQLNNFAIANANAESANQGAKMALIGAGIQAVGSIAGGAL